MTLREAHLRNPPAVRRPITWIAGNLACRGELLATTCSHSHYAEVNHGHHTTHHPVPLVRERS